MIVKLFLVFIGGGIGSCLRFLLSWVIPYHSAPSFPTATFLANLLASLLLGLLMGWSLKNGNNNTIQYLLMIGLCGGFSTFSTFSKEMFEIVEVQAYYTAGIYAFLSVLFCAVFIFIGMYLFRILY